MPYQLDTEILLAAQACIYIINPQHRLRKPREKSKWCISLDAEVELFVYTKSHLWIDGFTGWGIYFEDNNVLLQVGNNRFNEALYLSKFIDGNRNSKWHGYPADFERNLQDRPSVRVLSLWRDAGKIKKHHISKIRAGKSCNL